MRLATEDEIQRWDALVEANPDGGNALQTAAWGAFKGRWGWEPRKYIYELRGGRQVAAQWQVRRIAAQGEIWYCPKGPGVITPADYIERGPGRQRKGVATARALGAIQPRSGIKVYNIR
jgi:serine/alanine adding enzyme